MFKYFEYREEIIKLLFDLSNVIDYVCIFRDYLDKNTISNLNEYMIKHKIYLKCQLIDLKTLNLLTNFNFKGLSLCGFNYQEKIFNNFLHLTDIELRNVYYITYLDIIKLDNLISLSLININISNENILLVIRNLKKLKYLKISNYKIKYLIRDLINCSIEHENVKVLEFGMYDNINFFDIEKIRLWKFEKCLDLESKEIFRFWNPKVFYLYGPRESGKTTLIQLLLDSESCSVYDKAEKLRSPEWEDYDEQEILLLDKYHKKID
ncbi:2792_t:CDS:2 [Scutellospora calospora]|uniref:2792_t:CDS:1 n=1 Tax=Scutellospora calospora TaxID=85575 RepID=A0ACA9L8U4_9GLOM|nr:2792_t:CDS:2 [Scutellospora calospora]